MERERAPLSRERVLRAAVALADEQGIDALSMRRLARDLGVEAMSLYNHVAGKDDLLDGMVELVLGEIEVPLDREDWKAALRRRAVSAHAVLLRHSWACSLALSPARNAPSSVRAADWTLRQLHDAGFSAELTYHAFHAVDGHVMGFTLWELGHSVTSANVGDLAADFLRTHPADEYPYLAEHIEQHLAGFGRSMSAFEFVLDLILDGLERLRDEA